MNEEEDGTTRSKTESKILNIPYYEAKIETVVANPGIAERLEQDIGSFECHGFSFRRDVDGGNGILTSPSVPRAAPPLARLQINVSDVSLVASVGPFLRTLVRLCVLPIQPQSLLATVIIKECHGSSDSSRKQSSIRRRKNNETLKTVASDADTGARSIAHAIHMLIRNSMGAALFLRLRVVLPQNNGGNLERAIRKERVATFMEKNDDGCYVYPTVEIIDHGKYTLDSSLEILDRNSTDCESVFAIDLGLAEEFQGAPPNVTNPLKLNCLDGYDPYRHTLDLAVSTRMCTVRLTPILYALSQRLLLLMLEYKTDHHNIGDAHLVGPGVHVSSTVDTNNATRLPALMICLEKVSNLYRVLMLFRDYFGNLYHASEDDDTVLEMSPPQLLIICRSDDVVKRFESEAQKFIAKNFIKEDKYQKNQDTPKLPWSPRMMSVTKAVEFVLQEVSPFPVVGFDLHHDAITLSETNSNAKNVIGSAGLVLLGYESDGIPKELDATLTNYIEINSRTSINVVAAFSILCHLIRN